VVANAGFTKIAKTAAQLPSQPPRITRWLHLQRICSQHDLAGRNPTGRHPTGHRSACICRLFAGDGTRSS